MLFMIANKSLPVSLSKCLIALFRNLKYWVLIRPNAINDAWLLFFFFLSETIHCLSCIWLSYLADKSLWYWLYVQLKCMRRYTKPLAHVFYLIVNHQMPLLLESAMHLYWNASLLAHSDGGGWRALGGRIRSPASRSLPLPLPQKKSVKEPR